MAPDDRVRIPEEPGACRGQPSPGLRGRPARILFVSSLYHPHNVGGAEATVRMLAEEAVARGMEAVVVTLAPDGTGATAVVGGVRVHYLPLANLFFLHGRPSPPGWARPAWHALDAWNPVMARRLGHVLDAERPDVVNTHNIQGFSVAAWGAVARRGIPLVQTLHDYYTGCVNSSMYRGGGNCARPCAACRVLGTPRRWLSDRPAVVTTVSRRLYDRIRAAGVYAGVDDVRVIVNANDPADAPPPAARPGPTRPLRLGFLGRLERVKGIEVLFDALRGIAPGAVTVVVGGRGDPAYEDSLRQRSAGLPVEFRGWVEPSAFIDGIDALVVPSIWEEPLSRVSHEAMGRGVPVIGSRIGGIPEIVRDGETGFLFPVGDGAALARVIRRLIDDPPDWPALSERCRRHGAAFRLSAVFDQYRAAWTAAASTR